MTEITVTTEDLTAAAGIVRRAVSTVRTSGQAPKIEADAPGFETPGLLAQVAARWSSELANLAESCGSMADSLSSSSSSYGSNESSLTGRLYHFSVPTAASAAVVGNGGVSSRGEPAGGIRSSGAKPQPISVAAPVSGDVSSWIQQAIAATGVPASWAKGLAIIVQHESSGNPNAINRTDINAAEGHPSEGLCQVIEPTFAAYALPGHDNILNPVDNTIAAIRYIQHRYGSIDNVPGVRAVEAGQSYVGY